MNITVYCGSSVGSDHEFSKKAAELGSWMAANGHRLVFGGGKLGLMGVISGAALDNGGEVIGVTPGFFIESELIRDDLTELIVSNGMSDRRDTMIELADAFIALPGGIGTVDEMTEVMVLKKLGLIGKDEKPLMLYNVNGCYDKFFEFLDDMIDRELYDDRSYAIDVRNIEDIKAVIERTESKAGKKR